MLLCKQTVDYIVTVYVDEAKKFLRFCDLIDGVVEYDRASNTNELAATDSQLNLYPVNDCRKCFAREICKFSPNSPSYASGPCLRTHERALKVATSHNRPSTRKKKIKGA